MDGNMRWAVPVFIVTLAIIFLISLAGSADAARVYGTVTDKNGVNVAGATVTLYQSGKEYVISTNPATTGITGFYEFNNLPAGAYSVQADKSGYFSNSGTANLADSDVQLDLPIPGFDSREVQPTVQQVTPAPTPTPTPAPTKKPTPKVSNTPVPLPTLPPEPGFEVVLALAAIGLVAVVKWAGKK